MSGWDNYGDEDKKSSHHGSQEEDDGWDDFADAPPAPETAPVVEK
jgi:hypothetical protein